MKTRKLISTFGLVFFLGAVLWAIPPGFNIQGRLTDMSGVNRDGAFQIKFSVFSVAEGGITVWEKVLSSVMVKNGNFQVILQGEGDVGGQLEDAVKNLDTAYVEIKIGTEPPLVPRQPLLRSPFSSPAVVSGKVDALIQSDNQSSGTGLIALRTGNTDRVAVLNNGNVGVGTVSPTEKLEVNGRIKDKTGYLMPVGTIITYASATPPQGWLFCNGQPLDKSAYPELFAVIDCSFGCPDSNRFNVPDLRGEFVRGFDAGKGVDNGRTFGSPQETGTNTLSLVQSGTGPYGSPTSASIPTDGSFSGRVFTGSSSGSANWGLYFKLSGAETRPRNIALSYMIKY